MTPTLGLRRRLVGRRYHRSLIGNAPSSRGKTLTNESGETRSPHARYAQEARLSVRALLALRIAQAMRPAMTPNLIESMCNHTRKKPYFPRSARLDRHAVTSNTRQNPATRNGCPALPPCAVSEAGMRPRCSEPSPEAHRGGRPAHVRSGVALSSHKEVRSRAHLRQPWERPWSLRRGGRRSGGRSVPCGGSRRARQRRRGGSTERGAPSDCGIADDVGSARVDDTSQSRGWQKEKERSANAVAGLCVKTTRGVAPVDD